MDSSRTYFNDMRQLMGNRSKPVLVLVFAMGTLLGLMDLTCIALLAKLVGAASQNLTQMTILPETMGGPQFSVFNVGVFLIFFYGVRAVLGISFNYTIFQRTGNIEADLRAELIARFTLMPYEQRLKRSTGSLITSVNQWTSCFARSVLAPTLRCLCDATVGVLLLLYSLALYPSTVLLFLLVAAGLGFVYDRTLRRAATKNASAFRVLSEEISESSQQTLAGYKEIRVLALTNFFREHIHARSRIMSHALANANTISQSSRPIIEAILVTLGISILLFYSHAGRDITHELPNLAILTFVVLRMSLLVSLATTTISNLRLYRGIVHQLAADLRSGIHSDANLPTAHNGGNFVSLKASQLSFCYEGSGQPALRDTNFALQSGDALAIVGESGAGKTTLVDLLLGILKPTAGTITVTLNDDGVGRQQADFMGVASYLSQNAFVLNDTLRRNVALGVADADINDAQVIASLRKAKLAQYAVPERLDDKLGDRGARLSGGQRQRIVLARAFYHGHKVMILDEATNAIDLPTEIEIINDLLALRPEITLITITHRPEIAKLFPLTLNLSQS